MKFLIEDMQLTMSTKAGAELAKEEGPTLKTPFEERLERYSTALMSIRDEFAQSVDQGDDAERELLNDFLSAFVDNLDDELDKLREAIEQGYISRPVALATGIVSRQRRLVETLTDLKATTQELALIDDYYRLVYGIVLFEHTRFPPPTANQRDGTLRTLNNDDDGSDVEQPELLPQDAEEEKSEDVSSFIGIRGGRQVYPAEQRPTAVVVETPTLVNRAVSLLDGGRVFVLDKMRAFREKSQLLPTKEMWREAHDVIADGLSWMFFTAPIPVGVFFKMYATEVLRCLDRSSPSINVTDLVVADPISHKLKRLVHSEVEIFSAIINANGAERFAVMCANPPSSFVLLWVLGLLNMPLMVLTGISYFAVLSTIFMFHLTFISFCMMWSKPEMTNVLLFLSVVASYFTGLPLVIHFGVAILPATGEERLKRMLRHKLGNKGVAIFSLSEMVVYLALGGWTLQFLMLRGFVVGLHHYWTWLDEDHGIASHFAWNTMALWAYSMALQRGSVFYVLDLLGVTAMDPEQIFLAFILLYLTMLVMRAKRWITTGPLPIAQGHSLISAKDYEPRNGQLIYLKHKSVCSKLPDLHRFREWEACYRVGVRSYFGRQRGVTYNPVLLRRHYLLTIAYMRTDRPTYLGEILALQTMLDRGARPLLAQDLDFLSVVEGFSIATGSTELAVVSAKILTFAYYKCELPIWIAGFADKVPSHAQHLQRIVTELSTENFEKYWSHLKQWFGGEEVVEAQGIALDFFDSPLYTTFVKLITSVFMSAVLGEVAGVDIQEKVRKYANIFALMQDLANLIHMGTSTIIDYVTCGRISGYAMGFSTLESQIDEMLHRPLPDCAHRDYPRIREEYLRELSTRMTALSNMSRKNVELSSRYQACCRKAEEVKARVVRPPISRAPDIFMFVGDAGCGKSSFSRAFAELYVKRFAETPPEIPVNSFIYAYRSNGQKHVGDAIAKPSEVKAFIFDDFQQNIVNAEAAVAEAALLHAMAGEERTALSFASIEGKAESNQLAPLLVCGNTNNQRVFYAEWNFDRPSLARRLDLVIFCVNLTNEAFSASHLPTVNDIRFEAYKMKYVGNLCDPIFIPQKIFKDSKGVPTHLTTNRREAMRGLTAFSDESRRLKEQVYQDKITGVRCTQSGLTAFEHFGIKCGSQCSFNLEEGDGMEICPIAQSASSREVPLIAAIIVLLLTWVAWQLALVAGCLLLLHIYMVLTHKRTLWGYSIEMLGVLYFYAIPFLFTTVKAYLHHKIFHVSEEWDNVRLKIKTRGWTYAAIEARIKPLLTSRLRQAGLLLASIATCAATYKVAKVITQSRATASVTSLIPTVDKNNYVNMEAKRHLMENRRSQARVSGRLEDVKQLVQACMCEVFVSISGSFTRTSYALVSQNDALLPTHCVYNGKTLNFRPVLQTGNLISPQQHRFSYTEGANSRQSYEGIDVTRLRVSGSNPTKSLLPHLLSRDSIKDLRGHGWVCIGSTWYEARNIQYIRDYDVAGVGIRLNYGFQYDVVGYEPVSGDCGSVVVCVTSTGTAFIVGLHHAAIAGTNSCRGQFLFKEMLGEFVAQSGAVESDPIVEVDSVQNPEYSVLNPLPPLIEPDESKRTSYLPIDATMFGTIPRTIRRLSCSIRTSMLEPFFPEGGSENFGIPWFKDRLVDGEWKGPYRTLGESKPQFLDVDPTACSKAWEDLKLDFPKYAEVLKDIHPLPLDQAINGVPGVLKSMNLDTSAGHPHMGRRKLDFVTNCGTPDKPLYRLKPEVTKDVEDYIRISKDLPIVVESCMKVEVRPIDKLHKTRFFTVFPFFFLVLFRVFISFIMVVWRKHMSIAETMIGCNAAGQDWNVLGESLDGEREGEWVYMGFDFRRYDKSIPALLKEIAYGYFKGLIALTNYCPAAIEICSCLLGSLMKIFIIIVNEVFFINAWNHSGDPITVETNSVCQRFLFRYWFYKMMPDKSPGDFRLWVVLWTYGDDSLARVRKHPLLTQLTFASCCKDWGMEVTSSTKGELTEYMDRADLTFLKRGIVKDDEFGGYRAPLEETSIYKMLSWFDTKSAITEEMWAHSVIQNAAKEWFLHGRVRFDEETARLRSVCEEVGISYSGESWDYYMNQYKSSTFATWDL